MLYLLFFFVLSRLLTWGAGKFGQLGNNCRDDSLELQDITGTVPHEAGKIIQVKIVKIVLRLDHINFVMQVSAGCGHSGFVTENGHAFTFGDDRYNQLGEGNQIIIIDKRLNFDAGHHDFDGQTCPVPTRIVRQLSSQRCLQIACGSCHTLFLTDMVNYITCGGGGGV